MRGFWWLLHVAFCGLAFVLGASLASSPALDAMLRHSGILGAPEPPQETAPVQLASLAPPAAVEQPSAVRSSAQKTRAAHEVDRDVVGGRFATGATITGAMPHRMLLFSFDDGPSRATTPRLLDVLDNLGIKAVFFVTTESFGRGNPWEREHAEIVREIVRRGHLVGNHTETHRQLPLLRNAEIDAELTLSERKIKQAIGRTPKLIRPPGGALSKRVENLLQQRGYTTVLWTLYGGDLEVQSPEQVVRTFFRVLKRRQRETGDEGGIVLLHDTKQHSLDAVPRLVAALKQRNCELLRDDEELYDIVDDLRYFAQQGEYGARHLAERQADLRAKTALYCAALASR